MRILLLMILGSFIISSGCTLGPDYERPSTAVDDLAGFENQQNALLASLAQEPGRWWESFNDSVTNDLVETALQNNNDIKAAAARLLQAQGYYEIAHGQRLPEIGYSFDRTRAKSVIDLPVGLSENLSTTYTHQISVSYALDVFGKLKRSERAAWDDLLSVDASRKAVVQSVIAQVVKTRANISIAREQLLLSQENTKSWQNNLSLIERRYNSGLVSVLDVRLARENLAASKVTETTFAEIVKNLEYSLDVLLGRAAGHTGELENLTIRLPEVDQVPAMLPAGLLDRRPDVVAAEYNLASATERVGVSIANMYPDFTLTGAAGYRSGHFEDIFDDDYQIYSFVLRAVQPIFQGGRLKAAVEVSEAVVKEKAADYANTVLNAMRETEFSLYREQLLRERLSFLEKQLEEAGQSESVARSRYLKGLEKLLVVLESERRRRNAEISISQTRSEIWSNRVDLFLAIGGDWGLSAQRPSTDNIVNSK